MLTQVRGYFYGESQKKTVFMNWNHVIHNNNI